jgi:hypothetical protein
MQSRGLDSLADEVGERDIDTVVLQRRDRD